VRVFLDTNVVVSATLTRGLTADLFRLLISEHEILIGEVVLEEFEHVLGKRFRIPTSEIASAVQDLRRFTVIPRPQQPSGVAVRDPSDAWVLGSAEAANADILVTGDQDLLSVASVASLAILTPRATWERLRGSR
jgi:putative PIN family toxin of toxin-antitoxin system